MTSATVRISDDESPKDHEHDVFELDRVQVSFDAEQGYGDTCKHCHEAIQHDEAGWFGGEHSGLYCEYSDDEAGPGDQQHEPEDGPGSWCNSASIVVDDDENSVTCSISVGDPRGGFTFQVRKVPTLYNGDGSVANPEYAGKLLLHLPHPGEGLPHMALTFDHEGTYVIGGVS